MLREVVEQKKNVRLSELYGITSRLPKRGGEGVRCPKINRKKRDSGHCIGDRGETRAYM